MENHTMSRAIDTASRRIVWPKRREISTPDVLSFLQVWTSDPLRVGAIAPSGEALAELITREIAPTCRPVLELGPGTGVFTRALLARGLDEEDLTLVEYDAKFVERLQMKFPVARILRMDAARIERSHLFDDARFGAVISGLPLLSMPPKKVFAILAGAFNLLCQGGKFYQFTYALRCPVSRRILDRLGLKATCIGRAFLNIPPAAVYRISRRQPSRLMTP
jgi:phospholipid N-methyltransferase